ncbi:hypothetical protein BFJ63_vAg16410 [Fusarium oxysporum f. sp. narcissi]|uniref:Uncharacterized protein n=1 Tax=Fusarium oxysporum f. sp. narcissi TaxID=451672 RepID=A0A4Q2V959_FUSOX|nr:hypothetical protein BFJ63_vAg16410 [Fusarium oxysporum f. sp. narcissi]
MSMGRASPTTTVELATSREVPLGAASRGDGFVYDEPARCPGPLRLGIHTPANLNRRARAALLQNSPAAVNGPVGVSPGLRRTVQTPSSPFNAATIAAATEGAKRTCPSSISEQQPVSIIESANGLARERIEEYKAKLPVFQAFCAKFEEAAQQFTTGLQRRFAQQFVDSFLDSWSRELSSAGPASKPTYSSVAAASPLTARGRLTHQQQRRRQTDPPHRQGRRANDGYVEMKLLPLAN